jgi:hypothetical protein
MNDIEKIVDLIRRNYSNDVETQDNHDGTVLIHFKRTQLTWWDLKSFFTYHKLDQEKLLKEWRVEAVSRYNVRVMLWIRKLEDKKT